MSWVPKKTITIIIIFKSAIYKSIDYGIKCYYVWTISNPSNSYADVFILNHFNCSFLELSCRIWTNSPMWGSLSVGNTVFKYSVSHIVKWCILMFRPADRYVYKVCVMVVCLLHFVYTRYVFLTYLVTRHLYF